MVRVLLKKISSEFSAINAEPEPEGPLAAIACNPIATIPATFLRGTGTARAVHAARLFTIGALALSPISLSIAWADLASPAVSTPTNEPSEKPLAQQAAPDALAGNKELTGNAADRIAELTRMVEDLKAANQALQEDGRAFAAAAAGLPPPWAEAERLRSENSHLGEKVQTITTALAMEKARRLAVEQDLQGQQKNAPPGGASMIAANGPQDHAPAVPAEVNKLESELAEAKRSRVAEQAEQKKAAEALKGTIRELTAQVASLQTKIAANAKSAREKENDRSEIAKANVRLTAETKALKTELNDLIQKRFDSEKAASRQTANLSPPKTPVEQPVVSRVAVEQKKTPAQDEAPKAAAEMADLQRAYAALQQQRMQLANDEKSKAAEIADLKGKLAARDEAIARDAGAEAEQEKVSKLQRESIENLTAQVAGLQAKAAAGEPLAREIESQKKSIDQLKAQVVGLQTKIAATEQLAREDEVGKDAFAKANARLTTGTAAMAAELGDLTHKNLESERTLGAQAATLVQLRTSIDRLTAERAELQKKGIEAEKVAQMAASEIASLRREIAGLQQQKTQVADEARNAAAEIANLKGELAARDEDEARRSADEAEQKKTAELQKRKIAELTAKIAGLEAQVAQDEQLDRKRQQSAAELADGARRLQSQANLLSAQVSATRDDLAKFRAGTMQRETPSFASATEPSAVGGM
jgi:chromosome segregation ATPase